MKSILFNAMYSGEYMKEHLGHEAINLFAADNGEHYIYINPLGKIALNHDERKNPEIDCVLLGQLVKEGVFKVIAKATGLKMLDSTKEIILSTGAKGEKEGGVYKPLNDELWNHHLKELEGVTYMGVPIADLFPGERQVLATFKAEKVVYAKGKETYICANGVKNALGDSFILPESHHDGKKAFNFAKTNPYMLFPEKNKQAESLPDYKALQEEIIPSINWEKKSVDPVILKDNPVTMIEMMGKEYSELSYSNLIAFWLRRDKEILKQFVSEVLRKKDKSIPLPTDDNIQIEREKENIDLLISYGNTRIIIENKIKASVSEYKDTITRNQLIEYREKMEDEVGKPNVHCFLLAPNYSHIDAKKYDSEYVRLNYSDLCNFFYKKDLDKVRMTEFEILVMPYQYGEFCSALELHMNDTDMSNYTQMMRRMEEVVYAYNDKK